MDEKVKLTGMYLQRFCLKCFDSLSALLTRNTNKIFQRKNLKQIIMEAKIYNKRWWLTTCQHEQLVELLQANLQRSGFTLLNFVEHKFQPQGYTCLWLLGESHAALHTFPEENKSYVELSSCAETLLVNFEEQLQSDAEINHWQLTFHV